MWFWCQYLTFSSVLINHELPLFLFQSFGSEFVAIPYYMLEDGASPLPHSTPSPLSLSEKMHAKFSPGSIDYSPRPVTDSTDPKTDPLSDHSECLTDSPALKSDSLYPVSDLSVDGCQLAKDHMVKSPSMKTDSCHQIADLPMDQLELDMSGPQVETERDKDMHANDVGTVEEVNERFKPDKEKPITEIVAGTEVSQGVIEGKLKRQLSEDSLTKPQCMKEVMEISRKTEEDQTQAEPQRMEETSAEVSQVTLIKLESHRTSEPSDTQPDHVVIMETVVTGKSGKAYDSSKAGDMTRKADTAEQSKQQYENNANIECHADMSEIVDGQVVQPYDESTVVISGEYCDEIPREPSDSGFSLGVEVIGDYTGRSLSEKGSGDRTTSRVETVDALKRKEPNTKRDLSRSSETLGQVDSSVIDIELLQPHSKSAVVDKGETSDDITNAEPSDADYPTRESVLDISQVVLIPESHLDREEEGNRDDQSMLAESHDSAIQSQSSFTDSQCQPSDYITDLPDEGSSVDPPQYLQGIAPLYPRSSLPRETQKGLDSVEHVSKSDDTIQPESSQDIKPPQTVSHSVSPTQSLDTIQSTAPQGSVSHSLSPAHLSEQPLSPVSSVAKTDVISCSTSSILRESLQSNADPDLLTLRDLTLTSSQHEAPPFTVSLTSSGSTLSLADLRTSWPASQSTQVNGVLVCG